MERRSRDGSVESAVLIFLDGVGAGVDDPDVNPMAAVRGPLLSNFSSDPPEKPLPFGGFFTPLDSSLGVEGIPQSATGQTALLTGVNAPALLGRHLFGYPNDRLKEVIGEHSILKRIEEHGLSARFANAFRPLFFAMPRDALPKRLSVTTVATMAAGVPFFGLDDLRAGRSVYQEFTNEFLVAKGFDVPLRTPEEAGRILARTALGFDFVLYEFFQSDRAGHGQEMEASAGIVRRLEAFLQAFLTGIDLERRLVVVASDHGNLEDLSVRSHTFNPAQCLVFGPGAGERVERFKTLLDVAPQIYGSLTGDRLFPEE